MREKRSLQTKLENCLKKHKDKLTCLELIKKKLSRKQFQMCYKRNKIYYLYHCTTQRITSSLSFIVSHNQQLPQIMQEHKSKLGDGSLFSPRDSLTPCVWPQTLKMSTLPQLSGHCNATPACLCLHFFSQPILSTSKPPLSPLTNVHLKQLFLDIVSHIFMT